MAQRDAIVDVAASMYEAALQPECWPEALSRLGQFLGSTWIVLGARHFAGGQDLVTQDRGSDAGQLALFTQKYNVPETNPAIPFLVARGPGAIVLREQHISDSEWHRSGLYRDIYCPAGIYHGLGAFVLKTETHAMFLGVNRTKKQGTFGGRELGRLRQTMPHLQRAMQTSLRLTGLQSQSRAHEALWNSLACGIILLDGEGKVFWTNRTAATILARADGLCVRSGQLSVTSSGENTELHQLIRAAVATSECRGTLAGGPLSVSRPSMARALALLVAPIRIDHTLMRQAAAVVFVTDPGRESEAPPELLKQLYGLSAREAALARLIIQGIDLHQAADRLGVTMNTARTHLRLIFEKTDTHRQAELIRLLLRGPAGLL